MPKDKEDVSETLEELTKSQNSFEGMQFVDDRRVKKLSPFLGASSLKETFDIIFGGANTFGELETENNEQIDFGYNFKKDI